MCIESVELQQLLRAFERTLGTHQIGGARSLLRVDRVVGLAACVRADAIDDQALLLQPRSARLHRRSDGRCDLLAILDLVGRGVDQLALPAKIVVRLIALVDQGCRGLNRGGPTHSKPRLGSSIPPASSSTRSAAISIAEARSPRS